MDLRTFFSVILDPQVMVYLIFTALMVTGMILPFHRPKLWKWRYQFLLEGSAFAVSFALLLYSLGHGPLEMLLGSLFYCGTAFLLGFISLFVWMVWRGRN